MKSFVKFFCVVMLSLFTYTSLPAQTENFTFRHLTIEDGLSQSTIYCIMQDKKGFMWFGTTDGLNKYDGYKFTVYNHNVLDSNTISGNSITELYEDSHGYIWLGTNEGILNRFDRKTESFIRFDFEYDTSRAIESEVRYYEYPLAFSRNNNNTITSIVEEDSSHLLIGTWGFGLVRFNMFNGITEHIYSVTEESSGITSNRISCLVKENNNLIWIGTFGDGLIKLVVSNSNEGYGYKYYSYTNKQNGLGNDKIISLFLDHQQNLWIGTFHDGLNKLSSIEKDKSTSDLKFKTYLSDSQKQYSISGNSVMAITEDKSGYLWIGTFGNGLNKFDKTTERFTFFKNDPFNENSLADNDILSLHVDYSGVLWVGSHLGKGLSILERNSVKFGLIKKESGNSNSLNDDVVWAIYESTDKKLWIGTYRGGINIYNRKTNKFYYLTHDEHDPYSLSDNHVRSIARDKKGNYWIGTYGGGLNFYDNNSGKFYNYRSSSNPNSIGSNQIQTIYIDSNQICWIGTFGGGLNWFDVKSYKPGKEIQFKRITSGKSKPNILSDDRVYTIKEFSDGQLLIGTYGGGINFYNKQTGKITSFTSQQNNPYSLSDNRVLSVFEDSKKNIWIGTNGGGLNKFDKESNKFVRYNRSKGFNVQVVYGMLQDESMNLWVSSDNGLLKYNLITENVTYYGLNDGLQSMEFSGGAYFKNSKGEMFFGGINGLNYFFPDSVKNNTFIPPIVISEFKIFNDRVKGELDNIILSHDQNFFSIEYSALDYTDPENNQYAHYLEGLESNWHYTDALLRRAIYTNLEPGTYTFRVKGSNNDGVWNQEGLALTVKILPPFWKTWWFILISILLIGGLVSFLISMKVKHLLAMEKLKVRLAADLHDNVGAGLTEISILSELAVKDISTYSQTAAVKLNTISDIARQLVDSMSDIVWFVNPKRDSLYDLIIRLKDSYSDMLSELGVSFKTETAENIIDVKLPMDFRQNLYLIFKEGINNCIKHSKCNKISLETKLTGSMLEMTLGDDGIGIKELNINFGNGLRNMRDRAETLGGTLDINSKPGVGTQIKFTGRLFNTGQFRFGWS